MDRANTKTGAKAFLGTVRAFDQGVGARLVMAIVSEAGWFLLLFGAGIFFITPGLWTVTQPLIYWFAMTLAYLIFLETLSRVRSNFYETQSFRLIRILCKAILASGLIWITGGAGSRFWFFYLWPLFTAALYLAWKQTLLFYLMVSGLFLLISLVPPQMMGPMQDEASTLVTNVLLLFALTVIWKYLVETIRRYQISQKNESQLKTIQHLDNIWNFLISIQDHAEIVQVTLKRIANSALLALEADVIDLHQYDPKNNKFTLPPVMAGVRKKNDFYVNSHDPEDVISQVVHSKQPVFASAAQAHSIRPVKTPASRAAFAKDTYLLQEEITSFMAIPILLGDEIEGVLFAGYRHAKNFEAQAEAVDNAQIFAEYAARVIKSSRLLEQERIARQKNEMFQDANRAMMTFIDIGGIAGKILDRLHSVIEYQKATIQLIRGDFRTLLAYRGFDQDGIGQNLLRPISEDRLVQRIISRAEPLVLSNTADDEDWVPCAETLDVRSWVGYPLKDGGEVMGLLTLDQDTPGFYQVADLDRLEPYCSQIAEEIEVAVRALKRQEDVENLSELNRIGQVISAGASLEVKDIIPLIYRQAGQLVDTQNFYIAFYDAHQDTVSFELVIEDGVDKTFDPGRVRVRKAENGLTEYVIRTRNPLLIARNFQDWLERHSIKPFGRPARTWLGVPMTINEKTVGLICVQNYTRENAYDEGHIRSLSIIASHAAIAIDQAFLNLAHRREVDQLKDQASMSEAMAYEIIALMGARTKLELISRLLEILSERFGAHGAIYFSDENDDRQLALKGCCPESFRARLNERAYYGNSLLKDNTYTGREPFYFGEARKHQGRLEGIILAMRENVPGAKTADFTNQERNTLYLLATAAGYSLYKLRAEYGILPRSENRPQIL